MISCSVNGTIFSSSLLSAYPLARLARASFQGLGDFRPIIERLLLIVDLLVGFVSLAGNHYQIARLGEAHRKLNCGRAIGLNQIALLASLGLAHGDAPKSALFDARNHLSDDLIRIFGTRIVGGDYRQVG